MAKVKEQLIFVGGVVLLIFLFYFFLPQFFRSSYHADTKAGENIASAESEVVIPVVHLPTPEPVKALYMTACVASTQVWREKLKKLIEDTELNSIVIDIKDYTGTVSYPNNFPNGAKTKGCVVSDLKDFIAELHKSGIYVIGRISVFQDPSYTTLHPELAVQSSSTGTVWKDRKGLSFVDVGAKPYWDYIIEISKGAYAVGFDELNYDYVRYPSDGDMADAKFTWMTASSTKANTLESFFSYLSDNVRSIGVKTSADLFGMTTTVTTDMGIGQVLERALPHFDYIDPMVYPSHYPATWSGFANPAAHPYEVIQIAMSRGVEREQALNIKMGIATSTPSKLRPWLQDFDLGADYGVLEVQAQMKATYDVGLTGWLMWAASNNYTEAALLPQ